MLSNVRCSPLALASPGGLLDDSIFGRLVGRLADNPPAAPSGEVDDVVDEEGDEFEGDSDADVWCWLSSRWLTAAVLAALSARIFLQMSRRALAM